MKRFKFRFSNVLNLRKIREEAALRMLGQSQVKFKEESEKKAKLFVRLDQSLTAREELSKQSKNILDYQLEESFITGTKQRIIQTEQAILRVKRGVEKSLRHYLFCRRQTRVMERLQERDLEDFKKKVSRLEQKQMDDLVLMRANTKESFL